MELIGGTAAAAAAAAIVIEEDEEEEALLAIHTLTVPSSEHVAHMTCLLYDDVGNDDSKVEVGSSFSFANDSDMILDCP